MNVAPAVANSDAPTLGQVKNIATAAAQTEIAAADISTFTINDMRRELAELRAVVSSQPRRLR
jgi:hypothetical protein